MNLSLHQVTELRQRLRLIEHTMDLLADSPDDEHDENYRDRVRTHVAQCLEVLDK